MLDLFGTIWRFEIARIGNQPVRVSQTVIALFIAIVGLWLARRAARLIVGRLARIPGVKPNAIAAVEKLVFYAFVLVVLAIALETVNIPISAFAVLGGAFAIGLGFGAQNLFNNFISGLILIIEQPIRVGDLIEVDEQEGEVMDVGARCTRVRRDDGVDLLVPNSTLLESIVINWTLADPLVRTSVAVGVAYGSPTRRVAEMLESAVRDCKKVLSEPAPYVVFNDFGPDALAFEVFFWTEIDSKEELEMVRSEVRFTIDDRSREAGIVIAFPQRDVHLDATRPFDVRVVTTDRS